MSDHAGGPAELRVVFSRSRAEGVLWGMSVPQLLLAVLALFMVVAAVSGRPGWGWWLLAAGVLVAAILARPKGRSLADFGPALAVEAVMRTFKLHIFRGGPVRPRERTTTGSTWASRCCRARCPGCGSGRTGSDADGPPVCIITDTADGTVTAVLAVVGAGGALTDTVTANAQATAFGSMLDALARGNAPRGEPADPAPGDPRPG